MDVNRVVRTVLLGAIVALSITLALIFSLCRLHSTRTRLDTWETS